MDCRHSIEMLLVRRNRNNGRACQRSDISQEPMLNFLKYFGRGREELMVENIGYTKLEVLCM